MAALRFRKADGQIWAREPRSDASRRTDAAVQAMMERRTGRRSASVGVDWKVVFARLIDQARGRFVTIRQFHSRPRPRSIAMGLGYQAFERLQSLLPGIRQISSMSDVHQADWDLLISADADLRDVEPHLFVVAFGGLLIGKTHGDDKRLIARRTVFDEEGETSLPVSVAVEFSTPDPVPGRFESLIASDLVTILAAEHWHSTLLVYRPTQDGVGEPSRDIPDVERLVIGSDGAVYAAHFRRPGGKSWCLTLPDDADLLAWVEAAVSHWHSIDSKRFPGTLDWTNQAFDWLTPTEIDAAKAAVAAGEEKERAAATEKGAWDEFQKARTQARLGPMRLLTEQGEGLASAVRDVLQEIGFVVRDMDAEMTDRDAIEDLRASPPDRPDWVALVEVKGYTRSRGKAEDLLNLTGRFGRRFRTAEGREPDAFWYVVNHEMGTDPSARRPLFDGSDKEVEAFGAVAGLAIDTVDLFRLWRDVVGGRLSQDDARNLLVGGSGRLAYQAAAPEAPEA